MKKSLIMGILMAISTGIFAQYAKLVVFTENGDRFFLYINGKLQNASLQSNVTTKKIIEAGVTMKVVFDREGLGEKIFKLPVKSGYETTCILAINKKGEYVIKYGGEAPIEVEASDEIEPQSATQKVQKTTQTVSQPTTIEDGENMDVNINIGVGGVGGNTTMKYTQKVTTTSSSTSTNTNNSSMPAEQTEQTTPKKAVCSPMDAAMYVEAKKSVASKGFDETRITESKQILEDNCMTSKQIKELLSVFGFEESRLDVAKFAYKKCSDPNNYFVVNSAFSFEASVEELNQYIKSVKK